MSAREQHKLRDVSAAGASEASHGRPKAEELAALLEAHRGERHIVVLQSFPDPDAISSALAHQMIAARYQIECDIAYDGLISHHENVALVELLDISMVRVGDDDDLKRYQGNVFVDTQGTTTGLTERLAKAGGPGEPGGAGADHRAGGRDRARGARGPARGHALHGRRRAGGAGAFPPTHPRPSICIAILRIYFRNRVAI